MNSQKVKSNQVNMHILTPKDLDITLKKREQPLSESFALGVRVLLQNWRQGTLGVKSRGEVSLSGKKPWKQKGTGRARAGTARSPLWRGGGIVFGPQARIRTLKTTRKLRQAVMRELYHDYLTKGKVKVVDWELSTEKPQTKIAMQLLRDIGVAGKKITLFIPFEDHKTHASFVNIPTVQVLFFDQPNIIDLSGDNEWLIFKKDISLFKEMVSKCV